MRCINANEANTCTRVWDGGYDARVHRAYPRGLLPDGRVAPSHSPAARSPAAIPKARARRRVSSTSQATPPIQPTPNSISRILHSDKDDTITTIIHPETPAEEDVRDHDYYARQGEILYLQNCLPNHLLLFQLVEYHEKYLLWHHNCLHGPTFQKEVLSVLHSAGNRKIQLKELDLRWCGLLFAVLSASLTCAPAKQAQKWNLTSDGKQSLSKKWHEAAMECLVLGEFASKPHVYSVQTIQVLALSALILGLSNQQFVMFGTSLRIAQSLGLQRTPHEQSSLLDNASESMQMHKETSRRVWWNLVMQDWFSISSYDMFSIHPLHFTTPRPYRHDGDSTEMAEDEALVNYTNHILDIAAVMVDFHMATTASPDTEAKYEQVLKHDAKLRRLGSEPICPSSTNITWLPWARRVAHVVHAHKTIILHRHFLGRSFKDPAFAYTRWASIEASKVIVRKVEQSFADPERPSIWNDQAHLTGAGVTLCLDFMHRNESEPEHAEHRRLVDKVMAMLTSCKNSVLASRGHRLLSSMLREGIKDSKEKNIPDDRKLPLQTHGENESLSWPIENRETIDAMRSSGRTDEAAVSAGQAGHPTPTSQRDLQSPGQSHTVVQPPASIVEATNTQSMPGRSDFDPLAPGAADDVLADASWTEMLSEFFPDHLGFGNALAFDDLFGSPFQT